MQQYFPEGYYFCNVFHGLTWVELALRDPKFEAEAVDEATRCLENLETEAGREPFPPDLPPDHGMFYAAWKAHLRAGIALLAHPQDSESKHMEPLRSECDAIDQSIRESKSPFLPSYSQNCWPCDMFPGIHALVICDVLTEEARYSKTVRDWIEAARGHVDSQTGLLPHLVSLADAQMIQGSRATSQVIILRLLADIDPDFAKEQYEAFRRHFVTTLIGLPCVREFPAGLTGSGDVDSGPLIFGRSLSATVLMIGVAQTYGDQELADAIAQTGESFGLPWESDGGKFYWGRSMPVGDIIVGYSHVARPWVRQSEHHPSEPHRVDKRWRRPLHLLSACLVGVGLVPLLRRSKRPSKHPTP